MYLLEAEIIT